MRHENVETIVACINHIKSKRVVILGLVTDGFWSVFVRYGSIYPIQICLTHMKRIVRRYLTQKPKLEASKELKYITDKLHLVPEEEFKFLYYTWLNKWQKFLKERSYIESEGKWVYTHRKLRSCVTSLNRYMPYLFTYQRYSRVPNTNNSLEGFNSALKSFIKVHHGLRADRKMKLIHLYLLKDSQFKWG